jgi:DNA polymerase III subunit epsilon
MGRLIFYDTETTGKFPKHATFMNPAMPRIVSIAMVTTNENFEILSRLYLIIKPEGFEIPVEASRIHGITTEMAMQKGAAFFPVAQHFNRQIEESDYALAFNTQYDTKVYDSEMYRRKLPFRMPRDKDRCVMMAASAFCKLPNEHGYSGYAWPKLEKAYRTCFGVQMEKAHDALADVINTIQVTRHMVKSGAWNLAANVVL